jgi:hypothetical protein
MFGRLTVLTLALVGCNVAEKEVTDIEAMEIAELYFQKSCPTVRSVPRLPLPVIKGSVWHITYQRENGSKVESLEAEVDRHTGRLLRAGGAGCTPLKAKEVSAKLSERQALRIAETYVAAHWPRSLEVVTGATAHDQGATWIVTYALPKGSAGGTPTLEIDKLNRRVIYARHTQ